MLDIMETQGGRTEQALGWGLLDSVRLLYHASRSDSDHHVYFP